jgi:hypothetical protein
MLDRNQRRMVNPLLAMREPYSEVLAACSSMCIGSGSFFRAYSIISVWLTTHSTPHWMVRLPDPRHKGRRRRLWS